MADKIPAIVVALAAQVKKTPIAWAVKPDTVVIVFQDGPKMTFDREAGPVGAHGMRPEGPAQVPVKPPKHPSPPPNDPPPHKVIITPTPTDPKLPPNRRAKQ